MICNQQSWTRPPDHSKCGSFLRSRCEFKKWFIVVSSTIQGLVIGRQSHKSTNYNYIWLFYINEKNVNKLKPKRP